MKKALFRACFENSLGKGLRARWGGWRGATRKGIPHGSSTEEQLSQPPRPAASPAKIFSKHACSLAVLILAIGAAMRSDAQTQPFLPNGLIGYYPFNQDTSDYSFSGHNGTLFGNASFGTDRFGVPNSCLLLHGEQGIDSGVDVPSLSSMAYFPASYSAWVLISNYPPFNPGNITCMTIVGREVCGDQDEGALSLFSAPGVQLTNGFDYFQGHQGSYAKVTPSTNVWCHIVATVDSSGNCSLYLNGAYLSVFNKSTVAGDTQDFRIGCSSGSGGCGYEYVWNGLIDDVRVYNRALSSNEVQSLYQHELVYNDSGDCSAGAAATAETTNGFVYAINVVAGGCNYTNTPLVAIVGGGGEGATAVAQVSSGVVTGVTITDAGSGYTNTPLVYFGSVPAIVKEPSTILVNNGDSNSFNVDAEGTALTYQWYFDGTLIPGATSSNLIFTNIAPTNIGTYSVVVTNYFGSVASTNVVLEMRPEIVVPFAGLETDAGFTNTLSVGVVGSGPLAYQWFDNGTAIAGATNSALTFNGIETNSAGIYTVTATTPFGSVTNTPENVVVNPFGVSLGQCPVIIIDGYAGYSYAIQRNTNLSLTNGWVTLTNLTLTQRLQAWADTSIDTTSTNATENFYRIVPGTP